MGVAILLTLLVPTWAVLGYETYDGGWQGLGSPIDMRTAISFVGLAIYCFHPQAQFRTKLIFADYALLSLMAVHIVSDTVNDGFSFVIPLRAFGEWGLPYLCGRLALQSIEDLRKLLPYAIFVVSVLGMLATLQSILGTHVWEWVYHEWPTDGIPRNLNRMGLIRSWGPTRNPIYFGSLQLLLFPWAVYAVSRVQRGQGPKWWYGSLAASLGGIFFTLSRAPLFAIAIVAFVAVLILKPRWRPVLIGLTITAAAILIIQREAVMNIMETSFGDEMKRNATLRVGEDRLKIKTDRQMTIDGQQVRKTSARQRLYIYKAYGPFMLGAGWLGFGTERVTGFPIQIPEVPNSSQIVAEMPYVDHTFILMQIRFGYLGSICFFALGIAAIANHSRLAVISRPGRGFNVSMAGVLVATMFVLVTVWMPQDYGFIYLFSLGCSSGLFANRTAEPAAAGHDKWGEKDQRWVD
jgi:hypothetical protein